jgi:hypothetical protein
MDLHLRGNDRGFSQLFYFAFFAVNAFDLSLRPLRLCGEYILKPTHLM